MGASTANVLAVFAYASGEDRQIDAAVQEWLNGRIVENIDYAFTERIDTPEIRNWRWPLPK